MLRPLPRSVPFATAAAVAVVAVATTSSAMSSAMSSAPAPPTDPVDATTDEGLSVAALTEILTPEQITCIAGEFTPEIADDPAAAVRVLTDCDVSLDQLVALMPESETVVDPDAVVTVLALAGLDTGTLSCLAAGIDAAPLADDAAALELLHGCGLGLAELLHGLVGLAPDASAPPSTTP